MRIQESTVQLTASHEAQYKSSLEISTTRQFRRTFERLVAQPGNDEVMARKRMQKLLQSLVDAILAAIDGGKKCPEKIAATDGALPPESSTAASGVPQITWKQTMVQSIRESERTSVCGIGKITTCDGRTIAFNYALDLKREYSSQKISTESGIVRLQDPLILSFDGKSCELTQKCIAFDLNADGVCEHIPGLGASSGFLVFDRNGNSKADNGSELFGVISGDGFADLRELDSDRNGWIDEADSAWSQLALWSGDDFATLAERGVGALYASAVDAPFMLKTADNGLLGQIRSAGLYLGETGEVGQLQQVDLAISTKT